MCSFTGTSGSRKEEVHHASVIDYDQEMTLSGTMNKTLLLFLLLTASAMVIWWMAFNGTNPIVPAIGGAIAGLVLVVIAAFKPQYSPYLAPGYALFEGLFIGGISAIFEAKYPGIVIQAVGATFVTFAVCLGLYKYRIEKGVEQKMPKYMEWFGAMGLMITLVWLYIEFLRLLSKLSSND